MTLRRSHGNGHSRAGNGKSEPRSPASHVCSSPNSLRIRKQDRKMSCFKQFPKCSGQTSKPKYTRRVQCLEAACNTGRGGHIPFSSVLILYLQDQKKCISDSRGFEGKRNHPYEQCLKCRHLSLDIL